MKKTILGLEANDVQSSNMHGKHIPVSQNKMVIQKLDKAIFFRQELNALIDMMFGQLLWKQSLCPSSPEYQG